MTKSNPPGDEFRGWRTSLMVEAVEFRGERVYIVTGVIAFASGLGVGMCVDDGPELILPDRSAAQLVTNLGKAIGAKLQGCRP